LYPGIVDALDALGEAGIPLGICTSKRTDFAERILAMFGLRSRFRFISGGDVGVDKWRQIETLLAQGLISASTVMVGDRAIDLVAAHRNGLSAAGVLWGHGSREELEREQPRYLLSEPSGLLHFAAQRGSERQACRDAHTRELDCRTLPIDGGADRYDDPACARTQTRCSPEAGSRH
jgi:phosphoglycolate phosphatase